MTKKNLRDIFIRVLARAIDGTLFTLFFIGIFKLANADVEFLNGAVFAMLFMFCWLGLEAVLFLLFGTTFGKWFLGVKVTTDSGQPLGKLDIIRRTVGLFVIGTGFGFPYLIVVAWLVNLVIMLFTGRTLYDKVVGISVEISQVRKLRIAFVVLVFIALAVVATIYDLSSGNTIVIYN